LKRSLIGIALLLVALSSLALIVPTLAARSNAHKLAAGPQSIFALEHRHGSPVGKAAVSALSFSCSGAVAGNRLINVTEKVINDADSGQAGNYWGLDAFSRTIQVWNTGPDSYCAVVKYKGTFAAQAGQQSPGSTSTTGGTLSGDEVGTINGGYQALITGALSVSDPANWPLAGKVNGGNAVDYQCVIAGDGSATCPGSVDWTTKYFDTSNAQVSFSFSQPSWGWTYVGKDKASAPDAGKSDGVWVNASTGNSGDILDSD